MLKEGFIVSAVSGVLILTSTIPALHVDAQSKNTNKKEITYETTTVELDNGVEVILPSSVNGESKKEQLEQVKGFIQQSENNNLSQSSRLLSSDGPIREPERPGGDGYNVGRVATNYFNLDDHEFIKGTLTASSGTLAAELGKFLKRRARIAVSIIAGTAAYTMDYVQAKSKTSYWKSWSSYYDKYMISIYHTIYVGDTNTVDKIVISDPLQEDRFWD